jgi:D-xylose transport system ATP-binding protein
VAYVTGLPTVAGTVVLSLRAISKRFGAVQALADVDLTAWAGEVVALVGDNGAGKSTLVKVIAGAGPADSGSIELDGRQVSIGSPHDAQALGIATVYQDLALCDNLDVVGNLFLGDEVTRHGLLDEPTMERRSWELLRELSAKIPSVRVPVASLSGGQRQTVAISRSLLGNPKLVVLDEPTAALGVAQTAQVLNLIERLRERGLAVVMVSHNMADVFAVADRVRVLRLGRNAGDFRVADTTHEEVVAAITGASDNVVSKRRRRAEAKGQAGHPDRSRTDEQHIDGEHTDGKQTDSEHIDGQHIGGAPADGEQADRRQQ